MNMAIALKKNKYKHENNFKKYCLIINYNLLINIYKKKKKLWYYINNKERRGKMKQKLLVGLLAVVMCFVLTGCGEEKTNNGGGNNNGGSGQQEQGGNNQNDEIDLSQFTAVELPESSLLEDWMKPTFGVITSGSETMKDYMYSFTVSGVSTVNVDTYRELLKSHGYEGDSISFKKDNKTISLGTAAVETTKTSYMTITIEKD